MKIIMGYSTLFASLITLLSFQLSAISVPRDQDIDTASINRQTIEAYVAARKYPGLAIIKAHKALSASVQIDYEKGIADASLALGLAHFSSFSPGDSAAWYNFKAIDIYNRTGDITGKARAYYCLSYVYSLKGMLDESEKYSSLSLESFEKAHDKRGILNALSAMIYLARQKSDFDGALELTDRAIMTARSINDTVALADALNTLGNIYKNKLLFGRAIQSYFEALKLWEHKNDSAGLAIAYGSIGLMYFYQKEYDKALEYNFKKVPITERKGDLWELSKCLNNISQIYAARHQHDSSIYYLRKSLHLNERMNYPSGIAAVCSNIATTYILTGELDSANLYISKSVDIAERLKDAELPSYLTTLGHIQRRWGDYNAALQNARNAYNMAVEQNHPIVISDAAGLISDIYSETGRKDLAFDYIKEYYITREKINQAESKKQMAELFARYETEKKEQQIKILEQANLLKENRIDLQLLIIGVMILIGLIIISSGWLWIRNKNHQLQRINEQLQFFIIRQEQQEKKAEHDEPLEPTTIYKKWGLTERESEILYYLGNGCSNNLIGEKLFISENTVKFHIKNIYLKLDVKNRIQALLRCQNDESVNT
jgi:ATP/maltotriose-dependent transcriptional regulator MalT